MSKLNLKTLLLSSALAFGGQNALAKDITCPDNIKVQDNIGVVKSIVKNKIETSLKNIENFGDPEVVVITINSPQEYGYNSFEELSLATIHQCKIGYKGQNTGVIVWYGKETQPHFYIGTEKGVESYITKQEIKKLLKGNIENCDKFNTSCRMQEITEGLEKIVSNHFQEPQNMNIQEEVGNNFFPYFYGGVGILFIIACTANKKPSRRFQKIKRNKNDSGVNGGDVGVTGTDGGASDGGDGGGGLC